MASGCPVNLASDELQRRGGTLRSDGDRLLEDRELCPYTAAPRVRGPLAVANDIEVRSPTSAERTDPDIAAAKQPPILDDSYGGSRRPPLLSALPTAFFFPPAVGSRQPRHNATSRIPKQTAAPATADAAGGAFRTWPATTMIAPASAATA